MFLSSVAVMHPDMEISVHIPYHMHGYRINLRLIRFHILIDK